MKRYFFLFLALFFAACSNKVDLGLNHPEPKQKHIEITNDIIALEELDFTMTSVVNKSEEVVKKAEYQRIAFVGDSHFASDLVQDFFREKLGIHSLGYLPSSLPKWHIQRLALYQNSGVNSLILRGNSYPFGGIKSLCKRACKLSISLRFDAFMPEIMVKKNGAWGLEKLANQKDNHITLQAKNTEFGGIFTNNQKFIDNLGVNGASVFNYRVIDDDASREALKKLQYDLAIFSFGTNESVASKLNITKFKERYSHIVQLFKESNPNMRIVLIVPPEPVLFDNGYYIVGRFNQDVRQAIYEVADKNGVSVYNLNSLMANDGGKKEWIMMNLSQKNAHLTKDGYLLFAKKLYEYLGF